MPQQQDRLAATVRELYRQLSGAGRWGRWPLTIKRPLRVLLVDSDVQVLALISSLLDRYGYDVRTAFSCKEALEQTQGFHPQVAFTGIALVVSSGFELVRGLRTRPDCVDTVIIALTGHATELTSAEWKYAGFDV